MPRVSFYFGRWMRTTDMYPDYQLRLYDRRRARWSGKYVHESVRSDGAVAYLKSELQHYPYRDLSEHLLRMDRYTTLAARQMHEEGRRAGAHRLADPPEARVSAQLHPEARLPQRQGRPGDLAGEFVLRLPEIREAVGTAERRLSSRAPRVANHDPGLPQPLIASHP